MQTHNSFYIETFEIAPTCFDPKIIFILTIASFQISELFLNKIQFLLYYFDNLILLYSGGKEADGV